MSEEVLTEEQEESQTIEVDSNNQHPYDLAGEWFVLNAQSGHEKKVRTNILTRLKNLHLEDKVYEVVIPTDEVVEIPQVGTKHSLNVSVAAGIVLWDFFYKTEI